MQGCRGGWEAARIRMIKHAGGRGANPLSPPPRKHRSALVQGPEVFKFKQIAGKSSVNITCESGRREALYLRGAAGTRT